MQKPGLLQKNRSPSIDRPGVNKPGFLNICGTIPRAIAVPAYFKIGSNWCRKLAQAAVDAELEAAPFRIKIAPS